MKKKKDNETLQQNKDTQSKQQEEKRGKRQSVNKFVVVITVLAVLLGACYWLFVKDNKPSDTLVFTVGTEKVYLDEVNFCILQNLQNKELTAGDLQKETTNDGQTSETSYKQTILEWIMDYKVEYMVAKEQGIILTKEEEEKVQKDVLMCLNQIDARLLNRFGIERRVIEDVYTQCYIAQKLEEEATKDVKVDDQKYCTIYIMLFPIIEMQDDGNYATGEDGVTPILLSENEIQKRKADAENALVELRDGMDPDEVAKKYGVANYSAEESNLTESFEEPFSQYAENLKAGECSPVIEIASCYGIVKMIEENNEELAEQIMGYYQADLEKEILQEQRIKWYEQMGVGQIPEFKGKTWDKISLYDFVQGMEE